MSDVTFQFVPIYGCGANEETEARRLFEEGLGLQPLESKSDGILYDLGGLRLFVDTGGKSVGVNNLLFVVADCHAAKERLEKAGWTVSEMPWAPDAPTEFGFVAKTSFGVGLCVLNRQVYDEQVSGRGGDEAAEHGQ